MAEPSTRAARELSSAIAAAIDDLCQDLERYHQRQAQRLRLGRCIAEADELIEDLEGLSLAGEPAVPLEWQPRLDRFAGRLPGALGSRLRAGIPPTSLLDELFEIEEQLFRLKLGEWARGFAATGTRTPSG